MKKIISSLVLATTISTANAIPTVNLNAGNPTYNSAYQTGYHEGKHDAYNNVARAVVFTGFVVIAGAMIYHLGKESRWTTNEKGVVYRF